MSRGRQRAPGSLALTPGQQELFEATIPRVERAAKHLARVIGADQEEALSVCLIALAAVVRNFDPARGLSLTTLLWPSLYRAVQRAKRQDRVVHIPNHFFGGTMRADYAKRASIALETFHLHPDRWPELPVIDRSAPDPEAELITAEESAEVERLLASLTSRQRIVLKARARDVRVETIGECLGISKTRVYQIHDEATATIRRLANFRRAE